MKIQERVAQWNPSLQEVYFGDNNEGLGYAKKGFVIEKNIDYSTNSLNGK